MKMPRCGKYEMLSDASCVNISHMLIEIVSIIVTHKARYNPPESLNKTNLEYVWKS